MCVLKTTRKVIMNASKTEPLIILYTLRMLSGSHLVSHSPMAHTESWRRQVSRVSRTAAKLSHRIPSRRLRQMARASRLRARRGSTAEGRPAGPADHSVFLLTVSACQYEFPNLSICQSQMLLNCKNMDLSSSQRKVKWPISLRPIWQQVPKTKKQVRTHLVCTPEQDSRTWGLWEREEDQYPEFPEDPELLIAEWNKASKSKEEATCSLKVSVPWLHPQIQWSFS